MQPVRRPSPVAALPLIATALVSAASAPPSPSPSPTPVSTLTERATVEVVLIEVYVTDGQGRPVRNLTADNFLLSVDTHAQPIHSLEFRESAGPPPAPEPGHAPVTPVPEEAGTVSAERRFVLFFDDATSAPQNLSAARKAARTFLESGLRPADLVAVASFDRRLRFLGDFTTDHAALAHAIENGLANPARFTDYASDQATWEGTIADLIHGAAGQQLMMAVQTYAQEFTPRSRDVLRALGILVDSLSHYHGAKSIVFMGDGIPENPALDFVQRFGPAAVVEFSDQAGSQPNRTDRARMFDLSLEIQMLARDAAAAGVTIHSVQTSGLTSAAGTELRAAPRRSNALDSLALNTGGTRSTSNDLLKGLTQAEETSRAYYVIGFIPEGPPDGKFHTVQVRLKHASGQLKWRRQILRDRPEEARRRAIEAAYAVPDLAPDLGLEISAVAGPVAGDGRVYDVVMHVPPGRLLFVPQPGGSIAHLDAGFVVVDETRQESARASRQASILLRAGEDQAGLGVDFFTRIRLPRGARTITAVVSDRGSATLGAARLDLPAAGADASSIVGLSIYSLRERSVWIEVPPGAAGPAAGESAAEYTVGPALKATFSVDEPLACAFRPDGAPPDHLRLSLRRAAREVRSIEIPAAATRADPAQPQGSTKITLPTEGLEAGDYALVVMKRGADGAETEAGSVTLRLRQPSTAAAGT